MMVFFWGPFWLKTFFVLYFDRYDLLIKVSCECSIFSVRRHSRMQTIIFIHEEHFLCILKAKVIVVAYFGLYLVHFDFLPFDIFIYRMYYAVFLVFVGFKQTTKILSFVTSRLKLWG